MNKFGLGSLMATMLLSMAATAENVITMNGETLRFPDGHVRMSSGSGFRRTTVNGVTVEDKTFVERNGRIQETDNLKNTTATKRPPVIEEEEDDEEGLVTPPPHPSTRRAASLEAEIAAERAASRARFDAEFKKRFGVDIPSGRDSDYGTTTTTTSRSSSVTNCINGKCEMTCDGTIYTMNNQMRCVPRKGSSTTTTSTNPAPRTSGQILDSYSLGSGASR